MSVSTTRPGPKKITREDRCDQGGCNAAAAAIAVLASGELLFCRHHLNANEAGLQQRGATIRYRVKVGGLGLF